MHDAEESTLLYSEYQFHVILIAVELAGRRDGRRRIQTAVEMYTYTCMMAVEDAPVNRSH